MNTIGTSMLRVQIGPVQDFIAAARTSRDLWSGSYLLSRLMVAGLHYLKQRPEAEIIFPSVEGLGIYKWCSAPAPAWVDGAQTPCLSNKLIAYVPTACAEEMAQAVRAAIITAWKKIAAQVWQQLPEGIRGDALRRKRYETQVAHHLTVDYAHLPMDLPLGDIEAMAAGAAADTPLQQSLERLKSGDEETRYAVMYYLVDHCLNATRKVRCFEAWNVGEGRDAGWQAGRNLAKDSLTGREEQIFRMEQDEPLFNDSPISKLFDHHKRDIIGAMTLIKRLWYTELFAGYEDKLPEENAAYGPNNEDCADKDNHYYAVVAMDGDHIGAALTREKSGYRVTLDFHRNFSKALADFAQNRVGKIVDAHGGWLIYAGGDDVLALLPLNTALQCAAALREAFAATMAPPIVDETMTVSAGLAVAHSKAPLQDAVRAAREAESRAKNKLGRNAFSVCLMKRSGEIAEWGAKWDSGAIDLISLWWDALEKKLLSARGAHRYAELLTPYLSHPCGLVSYEDESTYRADNKAIMLAELDSMLDRQWTGKSNDGEKQKLRHALERYLAALPDDENAADVLVPLCSLIAFYARHPNEKKDSPKTTPSV